jgi:hypothetical protein
MALRVRHFSLAFISPEFRQCRIYSFENMEDEKKEKLAEYKLLA